MMVRDLVTEATTDYYSILNLSPKRHDPSLNPAEIKTAYKRALLTHHPDKKSSSKSQSTSGPSVDDIALAYQILSSLDLKAEYDLSLLTTSQASNTAPHKVYHTGLDTVDLDDLAFSDTSGTWVRSCRCGDKGGFEITEAELESNAEDSELITGCRGCSLWLRVLFSAEEG
jgi:diphthamide biosynthesis protein 4